MGNVRNTMGHGRGRVPSSLVAQKPEERGVDGKEQVVRTPKPQGPSRRPGSVIKRKDRDKWEARATINGKRRTAYFATEREGWDWIYTQLVDNARGALDQRT